MSESIAAIYHMTPRSLWEAQAASPSFAPPSLADEGFSTAPPSRIGCYWLPTRFTEICRVHL